MCFSSRSKDVHMIWICSYIFHFFRILHSHLLNYVYSHFSRPNTSKCIHIRRLVCAIRPEVVGFCFVFVFCFFFVFFLFFFFLSYFLTHYSYFNHGLKPFL